MEAGRGCFFPSRPFATITIEDCCFARLMKNELVQQSQVTIAQPGTKAVLGGHEFLAATFPRLGSSGASFTFGLFRFGTTKKVMRPRRADKNTVRTNSASG